MSFLDDQFDESKVEYPKTVELEEIFDGHFHARDFADAENPDGRADMLVPLAATCYGGMLCMGNQPLIRTSAESRAYKSKLLSLVHSGKKLDIKVAPLLSPNTSIEDIVAGWDKPEGEEDVDAIKMFLAGVSNDSNNSVDKIESVVKHLRAFSNVKSFKHKKRPLPVLMHLERKMRRDGMRRVFVLERERYAVDHDLAQILREAPEGSYTIEHVSDKDTPEAILEYRKAGLEVFGGIAPQYTQYTLDDLVEGATYNAELCCFPIFKTEDDRRAIKAAMLSGLDCFYLGTDAACHWYDGVQEKGVKINRRAKVSGGQTQIPEERVSFLIEEFVKGGKLELLNNFASRIPRKRFGLTTPPRTFIFKYETWKVPQEITHLVGYQRRRSIVAEGGKTRLYRSI